MKNGDISNQAGTTIGFRCIDFLVKYKDNHFGDKVLNFVFGKTKRAEFNDSVKNIMDFIYRHTDYNVDLIVEENDYTNDLKTMLEDAPYNRVVVVKNPAQITQRLLTGDLSYYVDNNDYRRSLINNQYAITLNQLGQTIKLKV